MARWKAEPVDFVRECFAVEPDPWQVTVLNWYRDGHRRIAMQACKGPGKTATLAWIVWHFLLNENANIAAISTSGANVRNNLWKELALWRDKCAWLKAAYQMTATRIYVASTEDKDYERTWFCEMRTWSKTADDAAVAQTLQGLHALFVLVVLDESGGMPDGLMVAAEGILANHVVGDGTRAQIIQAGNPTVGTSWEFTVISACVIGGVSLMGGKGRIWGTFVGVMFLEIILNGMTLMNVDEYWQYVARAILILGSVLIYQSQEMRQKD